jgi:hypothetical protein
LINAAAAEARGETGLSAGPDPATRAESERRIFRPRGPGVAMQAGGGLVGFTSPQMQQVSETGGYWEARVSAGMGQIGGVEAAYVGAVHALAAPGVGEGASLIGHGAEATFRLNVPIFNRDAFIIPFGVVGLGWMHYRLDGDTDGTFLARKDDIAMFPVGGGLTIGHRHLFLETRLIYRFTEYDDLMQSDGAGRNGLRQWNFGANFGYVF